MASGDHFTTAFRDHAIAAFELVAADYLLKPFRRERPPLKRSAWYVSGFAERTPAADLPSLC